MNIKQKSNKFRTIVNEMADLYEKKNSNYGDSFGQLFEELGPTAGLVPLWNKLHRATSLIKGDKNNFESLEDTFKDLACYAIMNLIEMEAQKDKKYNDNSSLPEYTKCKVFNLIKKNNDAFVTSSCYGCKYTNCPYYKPSYINPNLNEESLITKYNWTGNCGDCPIKELFKTGATYVRDIPCQWCKKNPNNLTCGTTTTTINNNKLTASNHLDDKKGEINSEK